MVRWALWSVVAALGVVFLALLMLNRETGDLGGTSLRLVAYGPADAPIPVDAPATITFEANGRVGGHTGCKGFSGSGSYRAANGRPSFADDERAFTTQFCDPASAEGAQDAFFREHLPGGADYTLTNGRLILHFDDGQVAEYVTP